MNVDNQILENDGPFFREGRDDRRNKHLNTFAIKD